MSERPVVWPVKIFYPILAIFPLLLAAYFTATYVIGYHGAHIYLPVLISGWGALACLCIYAFRRVSVSVSRRQEWLLLCVLALFAFAVRMYAVLLFQTQPTSDFLLAHQNAVSLAQTGVPSNPNKYTMASAWGVYAITLSAVYSLFGSSVLTAQVLNCVLDTATVVLLYFGTKFCLKSRLIAFFAASFYAFFPSIVLYIGVLSPEFIAIPLITGSILLLEHLHRSRRSESKWFWGWAVSIGLVWGIVNAHRPFGIVFLIAFAGAELLFLILPAIRDRIREKKRLLRPFLQSLITVLCVFVMYHLVSLGATALVEQKMGIQTYPSGNGYALYLGLGLDENLQYSKEPARNFLSTYSGDPADFQKACYEKVFASLQEHFDVYPQILSEKFQTTWGRYSRYPETAFLTWAFQSGDPDMPHLLNQYLPCISTLMGQYYLLMCLLAAAGCIYLMRRPTGYSVFTHSLFLFGFALIVLIGEPQGRYKCVIFPILCLLAAIGLYALYQGIRHTWQYIRRLYVSLRARTAH